MNGGHDLGGMHGLGPIAPERDEPVFHAEWERRVFALSIACGMHGQWNIDTARHARERQHPADYIKNSYYENWLAGLETLLRESGLVSERELASGQAESKAALKAKSAQEAMAAISRGDAFKLNDGPPSAFQVGDRVRVRNFHPMSHTRAPRYVRGHVGTIAHDHGLHVFADENAHGSRVGEPLYSVRFEAAELWGPDGHARDCVHVDLWQPHLEPAP